MILLGLGSNLDSSFGDRFQNIDLALIYLKTKNIEIIKKSSFYETPAYPNKKDPKFINIVLSIKTKLPPIDLISVLLFVEEKLHRKRNKKNAPRTCDIDIIDYNSEIVDFVYKDIKLNIPHKKLEFRNFVLFPLREIFPEWKHPKTNENINSLIGKLSEDDRKSIYKVRNN